MNTKYLQLLQKITQRNIALQEVLHSHGVKSFEIKDSSEDKVKVKLNNLYKIVYLKKQTQITEDLNKIHIQLLVV